MGGAGEEKVGEDEARVRGLWVGERGGGENVLGERGVGVQPLTPNGSK